MDFLTTFLINDFPGKPTWLWLALLGVLYSLYRTSRDPAPAPLDQGSS